MKIIAFSLWGNNPKYTIGAIKNAELARKLFPDWVCRFYVGSSVSRIIQTRLINEHDRLSFGDGWQDSVIDGRLCWTSKSGKTQLVLMEEPGDWRGMFWRFTAIDDPNCEVMISRDCDSRLSMREKLAVDEWLASDELIHVMRDHPHHSVPILGGMFGLKKGVFDNLTHEINEFLQEPSLRDGGNYWQIDQEFLANYVWTKTRRMMTHDDGFWTHLWGGKPFPSPRNGLEFVGQVFDENDITVAEHQNVLMKALK